MTVNLGTSSLNKTRFAQVTRPVAPPANAPAVAPLAAPTAKPDMEKKNWAKN